MPDSPLAAAVEQTCDAIDAAHLPAAVETACVEGACRITGARLAAFVVPSPDLVMTPAMAAALAPEGRHAVDGENEMWAVVAMGRPAAVVAVTAAAPATPAVDQAMRAICRYAGLRLVQMWDAEVREDLLQERGAAIAALQRVVDTDPLTGVANRAGLYAALNSLLSRDVSTGVVFVDLDEFKSVNDSFGHDVGDAMLCAVAQRLRGAVRPTDVVARIGGDEFVLVLPDADAEGVDHAVARIDAALELPVVVGALRLVPAATCGAAIGAGGTTPTKLVARADRAMYARKRAARSEIATQG